MKVDMVMVALMQFGVFTIFVCIIAGFVTTRLYVPGFVSTLVVGLTELYQLGADLLRKGGHLTLFGLTDEHAG